jgi:hypothetical protein
MGLGGALKQAWRSFLQGHRDVKSFEQEVESAGIVGRAEGGMKTIPVTKVVGSVGRAQNLRTDFFYKSGKVTGRFVRIGKAMEQGKVLPPIEVYKAKLPRQVGDRQAPVTEYYVVDGHHRVAMAKKLGQDYLDAHVVEYKVGEARPAGPGEDAPAGSTALPTGQGEPGVAPPAAAPGSAPRQE